MPQAAGEKRKKKKLFCTARSLRLNIIFVRCRQFTFFDPKDFLVFKSTLLHLSDIISDIKSTRIHSRLYSVCTDRDHFLKRGPPEQVRPLPPGDTSRLIFQNFVGIIQDSTHYCYHVPSSESSKVVQKCATSTLNFFSSALSCLTGQDFNSVLPM